MARADTAAMKGTKGRHRSRFATALALACFAGCAAGPRTYTPESLQQAARDGDAIAQYMLALAIDNGEFGTRDASAAASWYERAALQGHLAAQNNLGLMHCTGDGVPLSYEQALRWFSTAAEHDYAKAQSNLGVLYLYGRGTAQDALRTGRGVGYGGPARLPHITGVDHPPHPAAGRFLDDVVEQHGQQ